MTAGKHGAAAHVAGPAEFSRPGHDLRPWWSITASLLVAAIFAQAVFAGLMLSGVEWARAAHSVGAVVLIAATLAAGIAAVITLRRVAHGLKFGFTLLLLAVVVSLQTAVGKSMVEGANLMWLHVPLGVALVGFATQALAGARRLGRE
ncbi:MAG: hypothetical protein SGI91_01750 [Alphaproteobacteria bacterium]|nr:hypothetical protein [Alphaproteobacteria bacterium]